MIQCFVVKIAWEIEFHRLVFLHTNDFVMFSDSTRVSIRSAIHQFTTFMRLQSLSIYT